MTQSAVRVCPVCSIPLDVRHMSGEEIDLCTKCGGSFYDDGELERILSLFAHYERVQVNEPEIEAITVVERARQVLCPVDQTLMTPEEKAGVVFDRCSRCDGIWLDGGELVALRLAQENIKENLSLYLRLGA